MRDTYREENAVSTELLLKEASTHLTEIAAGMKQSLTGQQQIQGDIGRLNTVAERLEAASAKNEKISEELAKSVSKVLSNTNVVSAFLLGLFVSTFTNLGTDYLFDRHWSVDAINRRHRQSEAPTLTLPELVPPWSPPPPDGNDIMTWFRQNDAYTFKPVPSAPTRVPVPQVGSRNHDHPLLRLKR